MDVTWTVGEDVADAYSHDELGLGVRRHEWVVLVDAGFPDNPEPAAFFQVYEQ